MVDSEEIENINFLLIQLFLIFLMSNKQFFVNRYRKMGWKFKEIKLQQSIRINTMNEKKDLVISRLESLGINLKQIPFLNNGYWIKKSNFSVGSTAEYLLGLYSIQEAASQIPVTLFSELENKIVLDSCASPGGKTIQMANIMNNSSIIIALEIKKRKMFALTNQLERCRVKNSAVYNMDAREASKLNMKFDCVLLDVPCSGNPVIDRHWFNKRTIQDVHRNARRQRQILKEAVNVTKNNGEIVYSTCSLEPEENEFNIDWAINALNVKVEKIDCYGEKGLTSIFGKKLNPTIEKCRRIWPDVTQGFFLCKLKVVKNERN